MDNYLARLLEQHNRMIREQTELMGRQVSALESIADSLKKIEINNRGR